MLRELLIVLPAVFAAPPPSLARNGTMIALMAAALAGCGIKGPLRLPPPPVAAAPAAPAPAATATPSSPADPTGTRPSESPAPAAPSAPPVVKP
jgi:predicted small lipoprotein YifL